MNREIETLINNLKGCVGMFDYILTPIENNLLLIYINEKEQEIKELHNKIDKAIKYVSQLSSKGRDCEIYWDIKQEILKILKESDVDE